MSEYHLVSPLLDGFIMGEPISSHDGVSCCPAMRENSDEKYIVKIISVPANQKQLDALLLTGAYPDAASATDYFKEVADGIVKEAALLNQLAKLEGFLGYDDWQIVPMEGSRLGYHIYLLSPYRRSLEKYLRRHTMTHLGAVNLGLDLCAALSICRRAGYIHVDLKPSNVFMTGKREFCIGDLGFVKQSSLKYTSLPSKYCSSYSPPELHDVLSTLNPTADIYAVGMILYQIYNNGKLPFEEKAPNTVLPAPMNADYELAEIILKACDPNPRKRWQTPIEMGQALVSYMQRNSVNDVPIVPPSVEADFLDATYESAEAPTDTSIDHAEDLHFSENPVSDETAPDADDAAALSDTSITEETSSILSQAESLITDPESGEAGIADTADMAEDITSPVPEVQSADTDPICQKDILSDVELLDFENLIQPQTSQVPAAEKVRHSEKDPFLSHDKPRKKHGLLKFILTILILGLIGFGGLSFYRNYYLLNIDHMDITAEDNSITVKLTTDVDDSLLRIVCTDTYGNSTTSGVQDHQAVFSGLAPGTLYKLEVVTEGFHNLSGQYSGTATTANQTKILEMNAKTGTEDGSVILDFTAEGPEQDWIMEYTTDGEELRSISFTGHTVTINNLTVGKNYMFRLTVPKDADLYLVGNNALEFTASRNVTAENLTVLSCLDGNLSIAWNAPADTDVESWVVRCYSNAGYEETITVSDTAAIFSGIDTSAAHTVEVTAAGMTQNTLAYVSANPITIGDITVESTANGNLVINWNSHDQIPEGGWLLMYTMDSGEAASVIKCADNTATIDHTVPGADYHLIIQSADGSSVFGGTYMFDAEPASTFKGYALDASNITGSLCPTPDKKDWTYEDIASDAYTSTHSIDSNVSMVLYSTDRPKGSGAAIEVMFVIRDSEGYILPELVKTMNSTWGQLWYKRSRYCELDIPMIPNAAGQYTVQVYFNRALVIEKTLNIVE